MRIFTNNKLVVEKLSKQFDIVYVDGNLEKLFFKIRDEVHQGYELLSHPLSGSIKPNENPFKSVVLSKRSGELKFSSLELIENSINTLNKFMDIGLKTMETKQAYEDYALLDFELISKNIRQ